MPKINEKLKASETAVVAINTTEGYWNSPLLEGSEDAQDKKEAIVSFINTCQGRGIRIIYARNMFRKDCKDKSFNMERVYPSDSLIEGTSDTELFGGITPDDRDIFIKMNSISAFQDSDLEIVLRCSGIKNIIIVGARTDIECFMTARDSFNRDLQTIIVPDLVTTGHHDDWYGDEEFTPHDYHVHFINNLFFVMNADVKESREALDMIQ